MALRRARPFLPSRPQGPGPAPGTGRAGLALGHGRGAPRPDSAGVEISPSGIVGLLYQPSDKDRCEPTPLTSRSFVFFASPRPPREVWQVRRPQNGWKSSPPPASFLRKNGRLGSAAKQPASPGALCHRRFCQSSIGAMKTPRPAAVFPLDTFRDPPLCRAPGKLRGWFSRSGERGLPPRSWTCREEKGWGSRASASLCWGETNVQCWSPVHTEKPTLRDGRRPGGRAELRGSLGAGPAPRVLERTLGNASPAFPAPPESTARRGPRSRPAGRPSSVFQSFLKTACSDFCVCKI